MRMTVAVFTIAVLAGCSGGGVSPTSDSSTQALDEGERARPPAPTGSNTFVEFESGPVHPLALSADGTRLFVTNIPDNRLEVFAVTDTGLRLRASVPVGLEPVA